MRVDLAAVLALNNAHAVETSLLDRGKLERMWTEACFARALEACSAFLIAFNETARYDGANFRWFRSRLERFVYVDRIVTAPAMRGRGLARQLYHDLFVQAARDGHTRICCEVNHERPIRSRTPFMKRSGSGR